MDSTTGKTLLEIGEKLFRTALKTSPSEGNGFGLALGVLVLVAIYMGVNSHLERRDRRRDAIKAEERSDKRDADASTRAIAEQQSREQARDRVINEQRLHRDELRSSFEAIIKASIEPIELRVGDLERRERQHAESIILLKAQK
jgi:predicted  nucleic acid-binding Zn-ribbon protein